MMIGETIKAEVHMDDINIAVNTAGRDINIRVGEMPSDTINDIR